MAQFANLPANCNAVTVIVVRGFDGAPRVLVVQRAESWLRGAWTLITGGIDPGEEVWAAAVREVDEETGLPIEALYSSEFCDLFYLPDMNEVFISPSFLVFTDDATPVTLDDDHMAHRWLDLDDALAILDMPGHRDVLERVWKHFVERPPSPYMRLDLKTGRVIPPL